VDRIDLGFVDILPCEGCLDHPLLGPREELFRRREIVNATEPARSRLPVVDEGMASRVQLGAVFLITAPERPSQEGVSEVLERIGLAPNGRPWDCGACGYVSCRAFAEAAALGRTRLKSCPPYLDKESRQAKLQAAIDALTGLASFRVLRDRLSNEVARSKRTGDAFAVLFADLDNFKQVNDQFGHEAGNDLLRAASAEFTSLIRTTDLAARYGGDEFVVVLAGTDLEGGRRVADKLRGRVADLGTRLGYPAALVTVSIGVASYDPSQPEREDVLVAADRALYRAKAAGRNQVTMGDV
jgi:diguanylate cyclase (GGDEF)-like protein